MKIEDIDFEKLMKILKDKFGHISNRNSVLTAICDEYGIEGRRLRYLNEVYMPYENSLLEEIWNTLIKLGFLEVEAPEHHWDARSPIAHLRDVE